MSKRRLSDADDSYFDDDEDVAPTTTTTNNGDEEDEEEDPFDAFMNDIQKEATTDKEKSEQKARELLEKNNFQGGGSGRGDIDEQDNLESYFKYVEENRERLEAAGEEEFDDDGYMIALKKKDVKPLEKVDHSKIEYAPRILLELPLSFEPRELSTEQAKCIITSTHHKVPTPIEEFDQIPFNPKLLAVLRRQEIGETTPVQGQAIVAALNNMDIIGISETGSGKTLAFLLPMIQHVLAQTALAEVGGGPIGLVVAPTRELAIQIFIAAHPFCKAVGLNASCLSGGDNLHQQKLELSNGVDIVVCTPGRLIQHVEEKNTDLTRSTFIVFDEADRLFDLGFGPQINSIIDNCRPDRQTLMFSATFGTLPEKFARKALQNPLKLVVGTTKVPANITQRFVSLQEHEKDKFLQDNLVRMMSEGKVIIFVNNIEKIKPVAAFLYRTIGQSAISVLHGDMLQPERYSNIEKFRKDINVLLTTNVGARGLDIAEVRNVINYDAANNRDIHIHRIGRTGRAGQSGVAYTLLTKEDEAFAKNILSTLTSDENRKQICEFYGIEFKESNNKSKEGTAANGQAPRAIGYHQPPPPPPVHAPSGSALGSMGSTSAARKAETSYARWGFTKAVSSDQEHMKSFMNPGRSANAPPPPPPSDSTSSLNSAKKSRWG
uniref:ATP-dependent RNA helicase n=1 Tax=Panagrolaimus superbus TaxID=310955 RepID=A0A914YG04_9BILA